MINSAGFGVLGLIDNVPIEELKKYELITLKIIQKFFNDEKKNFGQIINLFSGVGKRGLPQYHLIMQVNLH